MEKFYSPKQLAKLLEVHPSTVRRMIKNGMIQAINIGSKKRPTWKIHDGNLIRLMSEQQEKFLKEKND